MLQVLQNKLALLILFTSLADGVFTVSPYHRPCSGFREKDALRY